MRTLFSKITQSIRGLRKTATQPAQPREVRDIGYLGDLRRPPDEPAAFDVQRALSVLIMRQACAIDIFYPDEIGQSQVIDTHVGPLTPTQSRELTAALIASSEAFKLDLAFLVALTYVNARWSPEAYDHGLRLGAPGFSFDQTRWGIGLFYGSELKLRDDLRFHSEDFIMSRVVDPQWCIDAIACELDEHLDWVREHRNRPTWDVLSKSLHEDELNPTSAERELWLAATAFYLRDRHKALDLIWGTSSDRAAADYSSSVINLTRKFRAQLTEPSA